MSTLELLERLVRAHLIELERTAIGEYSLRFLESPYWGWLDPTFEGVIRKAAEFMRVEELAPPTE